VAERTYYHGGVPGLNVGDRLVPSPPRVTCGCPVCEARAAGRSLTVGEYRRYLRRLGPAAAPALAALEGAPDDAPVDPPSAEEAVYITTSREYAAWYASRSRGDLYQVEPIGPATPSAEDSVPSLTCVAARVVAVLRRGVRLDRRERRRIERLWAKADRRRERESSHAS
jgi:hypothetical protein